MRGVDLIFAMLLPQVLGEGDDGEPKVPVCQSCIGIYTEPPQLEGDIDQQSVAVCGVELSPDCTSMAVGCNDTQVRRRSRPHEIRLDVRFEAVASQEAAVDLGDGSPCHPVPFATP